MENLSKKHKIVIGIAFVSIFVLIMLLPYINKFIEKIKDGEIVLIDFENEEEEEKALVLIEEGVKKEVKGDVICHSFYQDDDITYASVLGLTFEEDNLIKVDRYNAIVYNDKDAFNFSKSYYGGLSNTLDSQDGVKGKMSIGNSAVVIDYIFDLNKYDYKSNVEFGENKSFSLDFLFLEKDNLLTQLLSQGMKCDGYSITEEEKKVFYASDDYVVDETEFLSIDLNKTINFNNFIINSVEYNDIEEKLLFTYTTDLDGFNLNDNEYYFELYNSEKEIVLFREIYDNFPFVKDVEFEMPYVLNSEIYNNIKYFKISKREY